MKNETKQCPSRDHLDSFLSGELDANDESVIESHIAGCTVCESKLAQMSDDGQLQRWQYLLGGSKPSWDSFQPSPAVYAAIGPARHEAARPRSESTLDVEGFDFLEIAGRGGMGIVYKALQKSLDRIVAVKVIHSANPDEKHISRFIREAESIAKIQHQNVLQIYEVGDHDDSPFLVLEFVDGPSLAERLERQPQDPRQTAQLVLQLTRGVAAAHQHGIVHRDLKPANILLSPLKNDSNGGTKSGEPESKSEFASWPLDQFVPKVADFGLAKDLDGEDQTKTNQFIGTPLYMSPEQIGGNKSSIGVTSDIYSIGVILYEMLSGFPPFQAAGPYDLLKKIETVEPIGLCKLNRGISSDLEAICFKCLEKSPSRRYDGAIALADDLSRFLEGRPVGAKPISSFRKTAKWMGRNPAKASLVLTLAMGALIAITAWANFTNQLSNLNRKLVSSNENLIEQQEITTAVNDFLQNDLLKQMAAESQLDWLAEAGLGASSFEKNPSLLNILDRVAERLSNPKSPFDDSPKVKATLLRTVGDTYRSLGRFAEAIPYLEQSVTLLVDLGSKDLDSLALSQRSLALSYTAVDDNDKAEAGLLECRATYGRADGDHTIAVFQIDQDIAQVHLARQTNKNQAYEYAKRAYDGLKAHSGETSPVALRSATTYARSCLALHKNDLALKLMNFVFIQSREIFGENHPATLAAQFELAKANFELFQSSQATSLFRSVYQKAIHVFEEDHPTFLYYQLFAIDEEIDLIQPRESLASRRQKTVEQLEHAQAIFRDVYHEHHPIQMEVDSRLAIMYGVVGRHQDAIKMMQEIVNSRSSHSSGNKRSLIYAKFLLAKVIGKSGDTKNAIDSFNLCLDDCKRILAADDRLIAEIGREIGETLIKQGGFRLAAQHLEKEHERQKKQFGADSILTVQTACALITAYHNDRDFESAETFARKFLNDVDKTIPKTEPGYLTIRQSLATSLMQQGKWKEAERIMRETVVICLEHRPGHYTSYRQMTFHGRALLEIKDYQESENVLLKAWSGLNRTESTFFSEEKKQRTLLECATQLKQLYKILDQPRKTSRWLEVVRDLTKKSE